jgi:hypothetical protein
MDAPRRDGEAFVPSKKDRRRASRRNLAENSMRTIAIGRKNWIHIGSPEAGPKIAAIISLVDGCRRLALPVR